jgi:hypothetical protein
MKAALLSLILIHSFVSHAGDKSKLPSAEREGLQKTQDFLRNKHDRDSFIKGDQKATDVDRKVEALTGGGADKEQIYDIAAKVMEKIAIETNGNPELMQKLMLEAEKDPQAFYNRYFSAEAKKQTRGLAESIEKKQGKISSPK